MRSRKEDLNFKKLPSLAFAQKRVAHKSQQEAVDYSAR